MSFFLPFQDNKVHLYALSGDTLQDGNTMDQTGVVTDMQYASDGSFLATTNSDRKVCLYELPDYKVRTRRQKL